MGAPFVIYTCITAGYDDLYPLPQLPACVEAHAFVEGLADDEPQITGWRLRPLDFPPEDSPRRTARRHKLLPHLLFPEARLTLWLDGSVSLLSNPAKLAARLGSREIAMHAHAQRGCLYQEVEACIRYQKDDRLLLQRQRNYYRRQGMPFHTGLPETTVVLRRNTLRMAALNEAWWDEISRWSARDQVAFPYVAWRLGVPWARLPGDVWSNPYLRHVPH